MIKNILKLFIIVAFFSSNGFAKDSMVEKYVHGLITDSLNILNDSSLDIKKKTSKVKDMLAQNLDSVWMGKFVLGRTIKSISTDNLDTFIKTYGKYLVSSYANAVSQYKGEKVDIRSFDTLSDGFFMVKTQVVKVGGNFISVDYLVHYVDGNFKVCDVITEGISLINSQRSEFSSILENKDGIQGLISVLSKKSN